MFRKQQRESQVRIRFRMYKSSMSFPKSPFSQIRYNKSSKPFEIFQEFTRFQTTSLFTALISDKSPEHNFTLL